MAASTTKNKVFILVIAILLLANIGMLFFILRKNEPVPQNARQDRKAYIATFLKEEIGFDQQQLQQFDSLSDGHRERMRSMSEKLRSSKGEQFKRMASGGFADSVLEALATQSAAAQHTLETMSLNHLKKIRALCKPGQLVKFDSSFAAALNRRGEGRKKPGN